MLTLVCDKYREGFFEDEEKFMKALYNSNWLTHISSILKASVFVVQKMEAGYPVLVHCSDGQTYSLKIRNLLCEMTIFL